MNRSKPGQFYGTTHETIILEGITLTDTEYSQDKVDWHYHENDYFTFILQGGMREGNKKELYECVAGDLLYHNWQDAHYNKPSGRFTRGFHVELEADWFSTFGISKALTQGSIQIADPRIRMGMYNIFKEAKLSGQAAQPGVDALLLEIFSTLGKIGENAADRKPAWVPIIKEALHETSRDWTLTALATLANIHPVHLSREFPKHFHTSLGNYLRTLKVQRALALLTDRARTLTDIALECGFADQSHFIRAFKAFHQITPLDYRKLLR